MTESPLGVPLGRMVVLSCWLVVALAGKATAQEVKLSADFHALRAATNGVLPLKQPAPARVDVVALRVEFQPDTSRFTTGEGTFGGTLFEGTEDPEIDPFPHNSAYFDAHLTFLKNYVSRVSDGKTQLQTHLLPEVIQVSKPMAAYSPSGLEAGSDEELVHLAGLVREAWTLAAQSGMQIPAGVDPINTAFVLFHAGVGRDLELRGTILDKTPDDLPSLYFARDVLARLGVEPIQFGSVDVSNSMIIPRTESRRGVNAFTSEPFVLELSINGLLAASFLNHLGVPDLFNTSSGETAVGPFDVMDALGIFAYAGLFPPEPSAWTKSYLDWADVQSEPGLNGMAVSLTYSGSRASNMAARYDVSGSEYFLVENRARDPEADGVQMEVWTHEGVQTMSFPNGDPEFNDQTVSGFPGGVVLDVDHFDFALPGGLDENGNALVGGILIWHVDEERIRSGLPSNAINADPGARAVDLEEADGSQDIGFSEAAGGFDSGSPFDFWFQGNPVSVLTASGQQISLYENRFGPDTTPDSRSNSGGASFLELGGFSLPGPVMTFVAERVADAGIEEVSTFSFEAVTDAGFPGPNGVLSQSDGHLGVFGMDGESYSLVLESDAGLVLVPDLLSAKPAVGSSGWIALSGDGFMWIPDSDGPRFLAPIPESVQTSTTPVVQIPGGHVVGVVTTSGPALLYRDEQGVRLEPTPFELRALAFDAQNGLILVGSSRTMSLDQSLDWSYPQVNDISRAPFGRDRHGVTGVISGPSSPEIVLLEEGGTVRTLPLPAQDCKADEVVLEDVSGDGLLDVIVACSDQIHGLHLSGTIVAGFPLSLQSPATSAPVITRDGSDSGISLFVTTMDGAVEGFRPGRRNPGMTGFPLPLMSQTDVQVLVHEDVLMAVSGIGAVQSWRVDQLDVLTPVTLFGDAGNTSFVDRSDEGPPGGASAGLLDTRQTYNWPNPVREGLTHIRFQVSERADIRVRIVDMAGSLVADLEAKDASPGVPHEIDWQPKSGNGVYFARLIARSSSGRTDSKLVKIAVIQ